MPPKLQTTSLWYHPTQQLEGKRHGDPRFEGRTPAYVVWNLLERYTREGDLVVDPFAGGGTSLDVAREMGRRAQGYDVAPTREDIERADARDLPLGDEVADFVFMDPPYGDHLTYSEEPGCIGRLSALEDAYFEAMGAALAEADRVLCDRRYLGIYVQDSFKKGRGFASIGAELYVLGRKRFRPIEHVAVVRGNRKLEDPRFHKAAAEGNFFLRGFNHLLIFKKERVEEGQQRGRRQSS